MKKLNNHKKVILKVLKSTTAHPTADWVYSEVRKEIPNISLGTVYRNLNYLKENNFILPLNYSQAMNRYDGNPKAHPHIYCTNCGKVEDIDLAGDKAIIKNAENVSGYSVFNYRLEFSGVCKQCLTIMNGGDS